MQYGMTPYPPLDSNFTDDVVMSVDDNDSDKQASSAILVQAIVKCVHGT